MKMFGNKVNQSAQADTNTTAAEQQAEGFSDPKPTLVEEAPAEGNEQAGSNLSSEDTAGSDEAGNDATAPAAPTDSSPAEDATSNGGESSPETTAETDSTQVAYGDQGVTVGRTVHYVPKNGGKVQPAVVVQVWPNNGVNLVVFRDGTNDTPHDDAGSDLTAWKTSVPYSESPALEPNTWHWPKKA